MNAESIWNSDSIKKLLALVLVMVVVSLGAYTYYTLKQANYMMRGPVTINVAGEGEAIAKPDIGTFSFSVNTEATDAATASSDNAEFMNAILEYLMESGVVESDIETTGYNLAPTYSYTEVPCSGFGYCPGGERVQDGFAVYQSVVVKVRDTENAGKLISGVGEKGATNISGLSFTVDDPSSLEADAKADAIKDAKAKAKILAESLGMRLGKIVSFYENEGHGYDSYSYSEARAMTMDSVEFVPDISTGEETVRANVNIIFELK